MEPNRISRKAMFGLGAIVVAALGIFGYTLIFGNRTQEVTDNTPNVPEESQKLITAKHQFADGRHTIAGETDVPTPCHTLSSAAFFKNGQTSEVELRLTTKSEGEVCAQAITPARFKVSFDAPEDATITATYDGAPVRLNLVPAGADENLDDYEIYIKG